MERLVYNEATQKLLEEITEKDQAYWRYQDSCYGGVIPVGHHSNERCFDGEAPEYIEEGASCYDNPYQLLQYMDGEGNDLDKTDVVLFVGKHMGYGLDEEDIVMVEEESDCMYSLSLRDFYKFALNADIYWNNNNIKEYMKDYDQEWIENLYKVA